MLILWHSEGVKWLLELNNVKVLSDSGMNDSYKLILFSELKPYSSTSVSN